MNKEKEIEEMAKELHCATNESFVSCRKIARILVERRGYGNVKQAVKEFTEKLKEMYGMTLEKPYDGFVDIDFREIDDLITELYGSDDEKAGNSRNIKRLKEIAKRYGFIVAANEEEARDLAERGYQKIELYGSDEKEKPILHPSTADEKVKDLEEKLKHAEKETAKAILNKLLDILDEDREITREDLFFIDCEYGGATYE